MAKRYGRSIGYVMLKAKHTQWKAEVDVLYRNDSVLVLRDWPNTPLPSYFIVAKVLNDAAWTTAHNFMATLNTGGIGITVLNGEIHSDFESINASFLSLEAAKKMDEDFRQ